MRFALLPAAVLAIALSACDDGPTVPGGSQFTLRASGSATSAAAAEAASSGPDLAVDPSAFSVGFLEMRLSASTDCSGPYQTVFSRSTPNRLDLTTDPEVASADDVAAGTYPCALIRISDLLRFVPDATEGVCEAGVEVTRDIYRLGNEPTPYLDPDGTPIAARGTLAAPVEDFVWSYFTTTPAAVLSRGFSETQVNPLSSAMVSPGTTTFYWDLTGAIGPEGDSCGTVGGSIGFR